MMDDEYNYVPPQQMAYYSCQPPCCQQAYDEQRNYYYPHFGEYYQPYYNDFYPRHNDRAGIPGIQENAATNRMIQQFLDDEGQVDIQKMLQTVGQLADTVQQVSPVIKQLNDLVRSFRA